MSKTPIWTVAAPSTRKPRWSREQIAQAALTIADTEGFDALSMRRVADVLGAGTMTLYYYVRTKDDLLTLVEDALVAEMCDACEPLPKPWRAAVKKLAHAARDTYARHAWAVRSLDGLRFGPNGLRHIEQSLKAVSSLSLPIARRLEILSIVDDFVLGHCSSLAMRRSRPALDRKTTKALGTAMNRYLVEGEYPQLRAAFGDEDPVAALLASGGALTHDDHFELGLDALLDGLARRLEIR